MVKRAGGFTLVEFIVSAAVTLVAVSLAVVLVIPATGAFQSLPEAADLQQRIRVAADALRSDLTSAGGGFSLGWGAAGALTWPAVLPCRWTGVPLSSVAGGCARADSITLLSMASEAPQALTDVVVNDPVLPIGLVPASACTLERAACRLHAGSLMLIADGTSAFDLFTATAVSPDGGQVTHASNPLSGFYAAGALVGEVSARSYYRAVESATGIPQLRRSEGAGLSLPVVDHVVSLSFQYFGDPAPPVVISPDDPVRRTVSYGPSPPLRGTDNPLDAWPAGENCMFADDGEHQVPRLAALPADASRLAPLPLSMFADGPWCPDPGSPNRYDADLLRIRLLRVTLRLQAQSASVRGLSAAWFSHPGLARDSTRLVPDVEVTFDVVPRSMRR
ncbi:MAG: hypothetical protein NTV05_00860 [Acidobacteria bacterium]|nr:hypothetical protein [Acidobacteriota bacterium]